MSSLGVLQGSQLQEISQILRDKAEGCAQPKLKRISYWTRVEQRGWDDYKMPITAEFPALT
eukprot:264925-Amphidinium_carterae.1